MQLDVERGLSRNVDSLVRAIDGNIVNSTRVSVLEAGGGSASYMKYVSKLSNAHITTIDIDPDQIRNNQYAAEKILGDLHSYRLPEGKFDVVVCYNVLEHLDDPETVLRSLCRTTKPGGLLVIGAPNPMSLSGIVTKFTPHFFHVFVYRKIYGYKNAGKPGQPPFKTTLKFCIIPSRLISTLNELGMSEVYVNIYEGNALGMMRRKNRLVGGCISAAFFFLRIVSLFTISPKLSDYHLVFRRKELAEGHSVPPVPMRDT